VFPQTSTEAVDAYLSLRAELKAEEEGLQLQPRLPVDAPQELASSPLKLVRHTHACMHAHTHIV